MLVLLLALALQCLFVIIGSTRVRWLSSCRRVNWCVSLTPVSFLALYRNLIGLRLEAGTATGCLSYALVLPALAWRFTVTLTLDSLSLVWASGSGLHAQPLTVVVTWQGVVASWVLYPLFYCVVRTLVVIHTLLRPVTLLRGLLLTLSGVLTLLSSLRGGTVLSH